MSMRGAKSREPVTRRQSRGPDLENSRWRATSQDQGAGGAGLMESERQPEQVGLQTLDHRKVGGGHFADLRRVAAAQLEPELSKVDQECAFLWIGSCLRCLSAGDRRFPQVFR